MNDELLCNPPCPMCLETIRRYRAATDIDDIGVKLRIWNLVDALVDAVLFAAVHAQLGDAGVEALSALRKAGDK